jgi:Rne/Rng family ribonuclease
MSTELIINASLPETRIALMESGEIQDLIIERATGKGIVGNIYKGRVTRVLPGMQAAFVDIGLEKAAFLYVDDVFVHSEVFEDEEVPQSQQQKVLAEVGGAQVENQQSFDQQNGEGQQTSASPEAQSVSDAEIQAEAQAHLDEEEDEDGEEGGQSEEGGARPGSSEDHDDEGEDSEEVQDQNDEEGDSAADSFDDGESENEDNGPTGMAAEGEGDEGNGGNDQPASSHPGTVGPSEGGGSEGGEGSQAGGADQGQGGEAGGKRGRHRRGRRGGKFRNKKGPQAPLNNQSQSGVVAAGGAEGQEGDYPSNFVDQVSDEGASDSDRSAFTGEGSHENDSNSEEGFHGRPVHSQEGVAEIRRNQNPNQGGANKQGFKSNRSSDRRIPSRSSRRPVRAQVNIQDLLKEGQEVLVQVAKDPIATKGARLTCHISLPGRHLVCMPTIDHVGVSRRIERDEERRRLRDIVERNRPRNLGFIVRTASGKGQAEKRIKQDIDYLSRLWDEIREKSANTTAPALVYEDLNSVLRAIRDWVTDEIDKIIVDSRYHYNDILRFVSHFMPSLKQKVELYHGDIPIFDAYNISTELSRALERKVWLKSGGYLVIDQAEALVAIDVNTGRYVGKKNLEDTILKTNLEAVQEIAYQLRLRNCGGIIILDLIDMEKEENKQRVYRALEEALKRDRARPSILKISELGLVEMTRKRTRDTIVRALCESCSHCEGKGFIKSKTTVAYEVLREIEREGIERDVSKILVQAHPEVIDILAIEERETLDQIERRYKKQIYLQAVVDSHIEQFEVAGDKKPGKTAGDFSEVVQTYKTHTSSNNNDRDKDRGRGGRDRGRGGRDRGGRDNNRDNNRDRERDNSQARRNPDEPQLSIISSGASSNSGGGTPGALPVPRQITIPTPRNIEPGNPDAQPAHLMDAQPQVQVQMNDENYGNRVGPAPTTASAPAPGGDDFYDEEDRLAFLRAQATQDAALARLRSSEGSPSQPRGNTGAGGGRDNARNNNNNRDNNRGRRGRRGGKFSNRDTRGPGGGQNRNQRPFTPRPPGTGPQIIMPGQGQNPGNSGPVQPATEASDRDRGDRGDNDGGPGDRSQPPV